MTLPAAKYDQRVEFLKRAPAEDAMGTEADDFAAFVPPLRPWANVRFGTSVERRATVERRIADGVVSGQAATFRLRSTHRLRTIAEDDVIYWRSSNWGIQSIADAGSRADEIEFTAVRAGA
ncbi:MAG TPA: head-tail adaptor protein [Sphingopyxis sp.]|nr:head-tail adaptor protein [Sphingopyxis sp.]HMP43904.1 head-tail adaptor protein [Sphingopyxis sp.]HMQ18071.1 head-tail adaptor protein [Sphingopyxis sp.]